MQTFPHLIAASSNSSTIYEPIFSAPGAYSPEKVKLDATPQYSFGIRHAAEKPNDTPGN